MIFNQNPSVKQIEILDNFTIPLYPNAATPPLLFIMCLVGGVGIECMVILADPPATYSYYAGIILIFITIHTFLGMRFLWASACSWTIVVLYEIAAIWIADTPKTMLINNNFFFISAVVICMLEKELNKKTENGSHRHPGRRHCP